LEAVIKETLRLFPSVPLFVRKLRSEKQIGDFIFPKDAELISLPFLMMRNSKHFNNPLTFNPERFINLDSTPLAFTPFSIGARKCPAGKYAFAVLKMMAVKVLLNFNLELPEGHKEVTPQFAVVLKTKEKILINIQKRNLY
jgi:cytochrome P450 family 4